MILHAEADHFRDLAGIILGSTIGRKARRLMLRSFRTLMPKEPRVPDSKAGFASAKKLRGAAENSCNRSR